MLRFLYLVAFLFFCTFYAIGQTRPNGQAIDPVVQLPIVDYDIIHHTTNGYITQVDTLGWLNYGKFLTLKNDEGKFFNYEEYFFNPVNKTWDTNYFFRSIYTKDNNNNMVEVLNSKISPSHYEDEKVTIAYQNGRMNASISEKSFKGGPWSYPIKTHYIYDHSGKRIKDSAVAIYTNPPLTLSETQYTYDGNSRCTKETYLSLSPTIEIQWSNEYEYYNNGAIKKHTQYNKEPSGLKPTYSNEYIYNVEGLVDSRIGYNRFSADTLKLSEVSKNYYNPQKVLTAITRKFYSSNTWISGDSIALKPFATGSYDTSYFYRWNGNEWVSKGRYIFIKTTVGISEIATKNRELTAYPNPATEKITIDLESLENHSTDVILTDFTGRIIKAIPIQTENMSVEIPLTELATGIYILKVQGRSIQIVKQ